MEPELRQMRYIVAVAQKRNFTRAAEQLHIAQQALSQQVRAVEKMLGVQLFDRGARPVELTPAGIVFVREAERALSASERVLERTRAAATGELGRIRLAYTTSVAYATFPALLSAFSDEVPEVKVDSREMFCADMVSHLREEKLDVVLTPRLAPADDLEREPVRREPLIVALPEGHPCSAAGELHLAELRDEVFRGWPAAVSPGYHAAVIAACQAAGFEPRLDEADAGSAVWRNIAAGDGVALVAASAAPAVRGVSLARITSPDAHIVIDALWAADNDSPAVRRFIEVAGRVSTEHGWL